MQNGKFILEKLEPRTEQEAAGAIREIGATEPGISIMKGKAVFRVLRVKHVKTKAANIMKQTFLAKGGDAAVSRHAADLSEEYTDVLLFATLQQYRRAIASLRQQPWGLSALADEIGLFLEKDCR